MRPDLLTRLAGRTLGVEPVARPRAATLFEPSPDIMATELAVEAERPAPLNRAQAITGISAARGGLEPEFSASEPERHSPVRLTDTPGRRDEPHLPPTTRDRTATQTRALVGRQELLATSAITADRNQHRPPIPAQEPESGSAARQGRPIEKLELLSPPPRLAQMPLKQPASEPMPAAGPIPSVPRLQESPEVKVSIGRIEVRAVTPPAPAPAARPARPSRMMSLDDYLRRGGGRR